MFLAFSLPPDREGNSALETAFREEAIEIVKHSIAYLYREYGTS